MEYKKEIERIMEDMECSNGFHCYQTNFQNMCQPKGAVTDSYVECGNGCPCEPYLCKFRILFGHSKLCSCPLRNYVYRKLQK